MLPVVLESKYREEGGPISKAYKYKPYQFLPFMEIFNKTENGFVLKNAEKNRLVINDDQGIGIKTEIGIILSQLLANDPELRVMILTYPEDLNIWKEELYDHFGLDFHIYGDNGKKDSDLLLGDIGNSGVWEEPEKFDVQIFFGLDYYNLDENKDWLEERKKIVDNSAQYLLRIMSYSDCLIPEENDIPRTDTAAVTVSPFKINKRVEWCEEEKADRLKELLNKDKPFRAVIFTYINSFNEANETLERVRKDLTMNIRQYSAVKAMEFTGNEKAVYEFSRSNSSAVLVCSRTYGLGDMSFCDFAIYYDIFGSKKDKERNGHICKINRQEIRSRRSRRKVKSVSNVDIIYLAKTDDELADTLKNRIANHEAKVQSKEADLGTIETTVEEYLTALNGKTNTDDKARLDELKGGE